MLVRAKLYLKGFDNATQSQKPHRESMQACLCFSCLIWFSRSIFTWNVIACFFLWTWRCFCIFRDAWKGRLLMRETVFRRGIGDPLNIDRCIMHTIIQTKWSKSFPRFRPGRPKNHIILLHTYFFHPLLSLSPTLRSIFDVRPDYGQTDRTTTIILVCRENKS